MRSVLLLSAALSFTACAMFEPSLPPPPDEGIQITGDVIQVKGVGKADPAIANDTERKAISRQAAMTVAKARLQAYAERIRVPGRGTVGQLAARDAVWAKRLQEALLGVETAETTWNPDGSATVVLKASRPSLEALRRP